MRNRLVSIAARAAACIALALAVAPAGAARLALVIGNDSYTHAPRLLNARSDARALDAELRRAGFTSSLHVDLDERGLRRAVREFKARVAPGDEVVVFFAGHGMQVAPANYLLPVDIRAESADQVRDESMPLQHVIDELQEKKPRFALIIVDACRNNPFEQARTQGRSFGARGLTVAQPAKGQMVMYAAGAGEVALDGLGPSDNDPNGLFTRTLLRKIRQPGLSADRMLREVRDEVAALARSVGKEQRPAIYDESEGSFFFHPGLPGDAAPAQAGTAPDTLRQEQNLWIEAERAGSEPGYRRYLVAYPRGQFADLANERLRAIRENAALAAAKRADDEAWATAERANTEAAFQRYLQEFPNGVHATTARGRLKLAQDERSRSTAMPGWTPPTAPPRNKICDVGDNPRPQPDWNFTACVLTEDLPVGVQCTCISRASGRMYGGVVKAR